MRTSPKKTSKTTQIITKHIKDNIKAYLIVCLIFLMGIILGVIFVNNMAEAQQKEVYNYLTNFTNSLKQGSRINQGKLLQRSVGHNLLFAFLMWFIGSTVIGLPIVIGMIAFRGFCIGYTISASIAVWGVRERYNIFRNQYAFAKYYFHSMHASFGGKWHENVPIHNER